MFNKLMLLIILCMLSMISPAREIKWDQTGLASWYGPGFHGRKMANGERFNMHASTIAHRTLPLGTKVVVVNVENGKEVTATVTDRGPYAGHRIADLSRGLASKLDLIKCGVGRVQVKVLSYPQSKSEQKKIIAQADNEIPQIKPFALGKPESAEQIDRQLRLQ